MSIPVTSTLDPIPLSSLAARCLVQNPSALGLRGSNYPWETSWRLSRYVMLTEEVADLLLAECRRIRPHNDFVSLLYEVGRPLRVRLQTVDVRGLSLDARQIVRLMAARPRVLRFDAVIEFSAANLDAFRERCIGLRELSAVARTGPTTMFLDTSWPFEELEMRLSPGQPPLLPCPRLRSFRLVGSAAATFRPGKMYVDLLLRGFPQLTHLELSNVYSELDAGLVTQAHQLAALVLHNVWLVNIDSIGSLTQLRHLDISTPPGGAGQRAPAPTNPDDLLDRLVSRLPHLEHLDISGTTLAGVGVHGRSSKSPHANCDIVGLSSRADRPLRFLGIYGCNASHRKHIPADVVGGDIGADQLLVTAAAHRHHVLMMCHVLEHLETLLQIAPTVYRWPEIMHVTLDAMDRFYFFKEVHIRCGAIVENITSRNKARDRETLQEGEEQRALTEVEKQLILKQLFRSVALHKKSVRIRHFIAIILMNFEVPGEMMFAFEGFLDTLGYMLNGVLSERDNFVERVLVFLLNKTCCEVDGRSKVMVGERGLVKMLLKAIHSRCQDHNFDDVMRLLWSCLWNVTDETPENCQLFLDNRGMRLFTQCLNEFKNDSGELVRNMMGLIGNIAEVPRLRVQFLTKETVETFLRLLSYSSVDLEISYHAAGVLSNMVSDGAERWTLAEPSCAEVMSRLERSIRSWDVSAERLINYRSLGPIIRLLRCDVPGSQLWATWALCSLLYSTPQRYSGMLESEGGEPPLQLIAQSGDDSLLVRLAKQCLSIMCWTRDGGEFVDHMWPDRAAP